MVYRHLSDRIHSASRLIVTPSATGRFPRTRGPRSRERSRYASPPFGLRSLTQTWRALAPTFPRVGVRVMFRSMPADVLSSYPYVVVRVACRRCTRKGSYRLARLAAKYGAEIPMTELLAHLAGDCAIWDTRHPGTPRCGAYFVDLDFPAPPPDRPTEGMRRLRLVKGGDA